MLTSELLDELQKLNYADKLRVVQMLVNELAQQEAKEFDPDRRYEVWSPYDSAEAAATLAKMLDEDKQSRNG